MSGLEIADVDDDDSYRAVMKREGEKRRPAAAGDVTRETGRGREKSPGPPDKICHDAMGYLLILLAKEGFMPMVIKSDCS